MRILLIEDDTDICQAIQVQLLQEGYLVDVCSHGADALFYALKESYDAIVLDRLLPGMDGLSILQIIRKNNIQTPIIMATAMSGISDRIDGLDCGADDYIVKPYDISELIARIRALTRRPANLGSLDSIVFEDLQYNRNERELSCHGTSIRLSKREGLLMEFLMRNPEKTLVREQIFIYVWGTDAAVEDGNLDNYIHFLRKRMKSLQSKTEIVTIHSAGYRFQSIKPSPQRKD